MDDREETRVVILAILASMVLFAGYTVIKKHTLALPMISQVAILAVFILLFSKFGYELFIRTHDNKPTPKQLASIVIMMSCFPLSEFLSGRGELARYIPATFQFIVALYGVYTLYKSRHSDRNATEG